MMYRKAQGNRVVFIGDGVGDFYAAAQADVLFTIERSALDRMCEEKGIPHRSIKTLESVQDFAITQCTTCSPERRDS